MFSPTNVPSSLNDNPKNFGNNNEKKNGKNAEPNDGSSNKNGRNLNDNVPSGNFDAINDYMKRDNTNEEESELYKDLDEDNKNSNLNENKNICKKYESDMENIFGLKNVPSFLNDGPKNLNNKKKNGKNAEPNNGSFNKNGNNLNDNVDSGNFNAINDDMKINNFNKEKSEFYKNLEKDTKNSNLNGDVTREYTNNNINKSKNINYNITNNTKNKITEYKSQEVKERLNQKNDENCLNSFDNGINESLILNDNLSFFNIPFDGINIPDEDSFLNGNLHNNLIYNNNYNNNYRNNFEANLFLNSFNDDGNYYYSFNKKNQNDNGVNFNILPSISNNRNTEGIICDVNDINNYFNGFYSNGMIANNDIKEKKVNIISIDEDESENEIDFDSINITKFNLHIFAKNYNKKIYNYVEPRFIKPEEYTDKYNSELKDLWTGEDAIFNNKSDLLNRNGIMFDDLFIYLDNKKHQHQHKKDRRFFSDNMSKKIKTQLNEMIYLPFSSYFQKEIKILYQTKKSINNGNEKNDYNYVLLEKPIYSILTNNKDNKKNIQKFIQEYNGNREKENHLFKYLFYKIEDCLDYFLFIKKDKEGMFNNKNIVTYLKEEYKKLDCGDEKITNKKMKREKKIRNKEDLKDYIASFLLLAYNLKRLYYLKTGRGFKKNY